MGRILHSGFHGISSTGEWRDLAPFVQDSDISIFTISCKFFCIFVVVLIQLAVLVQGKYIPSFPMDLVAYLGALVGRSFLSLMVLLRTR